MKFIPNGAVKIITNESDYLVLVENLPTVLEYTFEIRIPKLNTSAKCFEYIESLTTDQGNKIFYDIFYVDIIKRGDKIFVPATTYADEYPITSYSNETLFEN